jgi:SET domain-containing protein
LKGQSNIMVGAFEATEQLVVRSSAIHGTGVFARKNIRHSDRIIEYVGERIPKDESLKRCQASNEFIFTLSDTEDLDGNVEWNLARFVNHSCAPNCEAVLEDERIWLIAARDIAPGEDVTFNYGYDLVDYRDHPCRCGARQCVGFIVAEEFFEHVRTRNECGVACASDAPPA